MAEEEMVFQLLEEDRKARLERIVEERKITTDDSLVLGILRLHREIGGLHKRIDDTNKRIDELRVDTNERMEGVNKRIEEINRRMDSNFKLTVGLILGMWASMIAILIPILLKVAA